MPNMSALSMLIQVILRAIPAMSAKAATIFEAYLPRGDIYFYSLCV